MNGNTIAGTTSFGYLCTDYTGTHDLKISSDYLGLAGGYTFLTADYAVEAAQFCGVYDGVLSMFPGIYCKYSGSLLHCMR